MFSNPASLAPVNIRRKIFEFIAKFQDNQDRLPSQDTIRELFGCYTDDVDLHLEQLAREGLLVLDRDGDNGITLVPTYTPAPQVKVLGRMARHLEQSCEGPCHGSIAIDLRGIGVRMDHGMFAVQVLDDRMSDAGIEYGDIALLVASTPMRGDIVAVEEGTALVLRRYLVVAGVPHFLAENPTKPELRPAWETNMQGVLWGLVRAAPCASADHAGFAENLRTRASTSPEQNPVESPKTVARKVPPPTKRVGKSRTFRLTKKGSSPVNPTGQSPWPQPPIGIELNEDKPAFMLTEDVVHYAPWGEPRSHA